MKINYVEFQKELFDSIMSGKLNGEITNNYGHKLSVYRLKKQFACLTDEFCYQTDLKGVYHGEVRSHIKKPLDLVIKTVTFEPNDLLCHKKEKFLVCVNKIIDGSIYSKALLYQLMGPTIYVYNQNKFVGFNTDFEIVDDPEVREMYFKALFKTYKNKAEKYNCMC